MSQIQQKINYYQTIDKFIDIFIILLSLCASMISGNFYRLLMEITPNLEIFFYDSQSFSFFGILITSILTFSIILYFERFFIYRVTTYKILISNIFKICFFTGAFLRSLLFISAHLGAKRLDLRRPLPPTSAQNAAPKHRKRVTYVGSFSATNLLPSWFSERPWVPV